MRLIGLIGAARVGKDTVAEHLHGEHCYNRYAFADPMKDMLEVVFGDKFRDGGREAPIEWLGKSPRYLLQTLGTEWGRTCVHPELWTVLAEQEWLKTKARGNAIGLVISDVRFHNEADMILRNGGELWHILRDGAPVVNAHISEQHSWDDYPRTKIFNNTSLDALHATVDSILHGQF